MYRVRSVGIQCGLIGELHHPAQFVTLAARRNVQPDLSFQKAWNLALQLAYFGDDVLFLIVGDTWLPAKCKHVNEHNGVKSSARLYRVADNCVKISGLQIRKGRCTVENVGWTA